MSVQNLSGQRLGQYELREMLGVGGMGAVYRGYQASLKRFVAVKVLAANLVEQPGAVERFNREAETSAALEHPNIVHVYDYGTQDSISYLVMQLLTGGSLAARIARGVQLPSLDEIAALLKQLASALDYAHSRGVIHRDIKPSNVMFDNHGNACFVDFGIAKLAETTHSLTGEGAVIGTPAYMAPEQWRAENLTPAADQYALAATIYTLTAGHPPFEAPTPYALMHKHLYETPTPLHRAQPHLPDALTPVITRALAKDPSDRFPSVTALAQAFESAVSGSAGERPGRTASDAGEGTYQAPTCQAVDEVLDISSEEVVVEALPHYLFIYHSGDSTGTFGGKLPANVRPTGFLIKKGTPLPIRQTQTISTRDDNQDRIEISVEYGPARYAHTGNVIIVGENTLEGTKQGNTGQASTRNVVVGQYVFDGIHPAPRGSRSIDLAFDVSTALDLTITLTERSTRKTGRFGPLPLAKVPVPEISGDTADREEDMLRLLGDFFSPRPAVLTLQRAIAIAEAGERPTPILPAGVSLPANVTKVYTLDDPQQRALLIELTYGDAPSAAKNLFLGRFHFARPDVKEASKIAITVRIDEQTLLIVTARDLQSRKEEVIGRVPLDKIVPELKAPRLGGLPIGEGVSPARGKDLRLPLPVSLREAVSGAEHPLRVTRSKINCMDCGGSGSQDNHPCPVCNGSGVQSFEESVRVNIPPGANNGELIRLDGQGEPGSGGMPDGDLLLTVQIEPDPLFTRQGDDLILILAVSASKAAAGGTLAIPLIDGSSKTIRLPAHSQDGTAIRIKGQGVRSRREGWFARRGDLIVKLEVR